jgi:Rieske Fe-S protein
MGSLTRIQCPCHGSQSALGGRVLRGPATLPRTVYPAELAGDEIIVTL